MSGVKGIWRAKIEKKDLIFTMTLVQAFVLSFKNRMDYIFQEKKI